MSKKNMEVSPQQSHSPGVTTVNMFIHPDFVFLYTKL